MMAAADAANAAMLAGTVGSGLLGGLYSIFSFCVMQALNTQPPATAIHVMNSINEAIINPPFFLIFMGTPLACCYVLFRCVKEGIRSPDHTLAASGALLLLVGEFLLTAFVHVPKNDALARYVVTGSGNDATVWAKYFTSWTRWNHVRMLASIATSALLASALSLRGARLSAGGGAGTAPLMH